MGTWNQNSGGWTLSGGGVRTVLLAAGQFPGGSAFRLQMTDVAHGVRAVLRSDDLGLSCLEVGYDTTGTGGNVFVREVIFGTPQSADETQPHGLTTGQPFSMEVRIVDGELEIRQNGADAPVLTYTIPPGTFEMQARYGFVGQTDQARVTSAQLVELVPTTRDRSEVLVAVCDGNVWLCDDDTPRGESMWMLAPNKFVSTADVSLQDYQQAVYGVDGNNAVKIDVVTLVAEPWLISPGSGLHLGEAGNGGNSEGKTRATILRRYGDRLVQAGDPQDPQNVLFFAIGDPLNANLGDLRRGKAWILSGAVGRVGDPITCLAEMSSGALCIGTTKGILRMLGDLAYGIPDLKPAMLGAGVSGQEATALVAEGRLAVHTSAGLYIMGAAGDPVPLSSPVLTEGIDIPRELAGDYLVQVRREARRHSLYCFLTPRLSGDVDRVSFAYEERVGLYVPGSGGFQPDTYADDVGPTASVEWRGRVVMGGRDGYLYEFDDAAASDDGDEIDSYCPLTQVRQSITGDVMLTRLEVMLGEGSGTVGVKVYGGRTAEEAYQRKTLERRFVENLAYPGGRITRSARGRTLVVMLQQVSATERWSLEEVEARFERRKLRTPGMGDAPAAVVPALPPSEIPTEVDPGPDTGPGPGGGTPPSAILYPPEYFNSQAPTLFDPIDVEHQADPVLQTNLVSPQVRLTYDTVDDFQHAFVIVGGEGVVTALALFIYGQSVAVAGYGIIVNAGGLEGSATYGAIINSDWWESPPGLDIDEHSPNFPSGSY